MKLRATVVLVATVLGALGTARLGVWQLDRAAQRRGLQAEVDARTAMAPLPPTELARDEGEVAAQLHRRVTLQGRWLDAHTVYLDNRQMHGRVGFIVVTPLQLEDGSAVVVQRGWVGRDFVDRARIAPLAPESGRVGVEGRIARAPARLFEFDGADGGVIRQNLDLPMFAFEIGARLRPVSILQTGPPSAVLQRDWPQVAAGAQRNMGYAFQWFALCALIVILYAWYQLIRPRRRHRA